MNRTLWLLLSALLLASPAYADPTADLWKAKCRSCHGEDGKADTKQGRKHEIADISGATWHDAHTDAQIRAVIHDGVPDTKMKAYGDKLSAAEIDGLVKYVRSLKQ